MHNHRSNTGTTVSFCYNVIMLFLNTTVQLLESSAQQLEDHHYSL
jgi:hypothetical protein